MLGAMLRDRGAIDDVARLLRADDFYDARHREVYLAIQSLAERGKHADAVAVADLLKKGGRLDDGGGYAYLGEIWDATPTSAHALHHAEIVRDHALCRSLIHVGTEMVRDGHGQPAPGAEMAAAFEQRIFDLSALGAAGESAALKESLQEALDRIDARQSGKLSGTLTGLDDLDAITAGLQDAEVTVIGARPSVGKTSLGISIALHAALRLELPVLFVSLEQSRTELAERMLLSEAKVDSHKVRTGHVSADDSRHLTETSNAMSNARLWIDDNATGQSMFRIAANARRHRRKHGIRLVVVDYLQLIEPEQARGSRAEQIGQISRRLKLLAMELKVPLLVMAQVNREADDHPEPQLRHLREGGIENDADCVILLHKDSEQSGSACDVVKAKVAKNRNGKVGTANLAYRRACMRFENYIEGGVSPFDP